MITNRIQKVQKNKKNTMKTNWQKGSQIHQKGTEITLLEEIDALNHQQSQQRIVGNSLYRQSIQFRKYRRAIERLQNIIEVQSSELIEYPDDLPTSFVSFEIGLAKYIAQLLGNSDDKIPDELHVLSLLRDYRVVALRQDGKMSVSPDKLYLILEDNFPDSYLKFLFDVLLKDSKMCFAKIISFD